MTGVAQRLQGALEAGSLAIHAVHDDEPRQLELVRSLPQLLGLHHHTRHAVDDDRCGVCDVERGASFAHEVAHSGRVDEIDLLLVPLGIGEAGRERVLAGDFFFVEVGCGRAVVNPAEPVHHARVGENGRGKLRLARTGVTNQRNVADGSGVVDLHGMPPARIIVTEARSRNHATFRQEASTTEITEDERNARLQSLEPVTSVGYVSSVVELFGPARDAIRSGALRWDRAGTP